MLEVVHTLKLLHVVFLFALFSLLLVKIQCCRGKKLFCTQTFRDGPTVKSWYCTQLRVSGPLVKALPNYIIKQPMFRGATRGFCVGEIVLPETL